MKTIHKYPLRMEDEHAGEDLVVAMPSGAQVLTVQAQRGVPCLWAMVDPEAKSTSRRFRVVATGEPIAELAHDWTYVGTFQLSAGDFVFHVFETTPVNWGPSRLRGPA